MATEEKLDDIDIKILKLLQQNSRLTVKELADRFIAEYYVDAKALGIRPATVHPKATEHIAEIIQLITRLIDEGQKRGEIVADRPVHEIARIYGLCERALISDWCMNNGEYDLGEMSHQYMPLLFSTFRGKPEK